MPLLNVNATAYSDFETQIRPAQNSKTEVSLPRPLYNHQKQSNNMKLIAIWLNHYTHYTHLIRPVQYRWIVYIVKQGKLASHETLGIHYEFSWRHLFWIKWVGILFTVYKNLHVPFDFNMHNIQVPLFWFELNRHSRIKGHVDAMF